MFTPFIHPTDPTSSDADISISKQEEIRSCFVAFPGDDRAVQPPGKRREGSLFPLGVKDRQARVYHSAAFPIVAMHPNILLFEEITYLPHNAASASQTAGVWAIRRDMAYAIR